MCPDTHPHPLRRSTAALMFWPAAIFGAAFDLWSKWALFNWLPTLEPVGYVIINGQSVPEYRYVLVDGFLQFILRENNGAAFSIFQGWTPFLVGVSAVALLVVIGVFFFGKIQSKLMLFSLGCMTAGIIGNLYDRAFNGGLVRDFIDVYAGSHHFPTFNVADSMLCIGVGLMLIVSLRSDSSAKT